MPTFTSGLGSQLGWATESTYGTPVTPNRFAEYQSEGIKLDKEFLNSRQLRAGRMFQASTRRVATTRQAGGPLSMEVPNKGFGSLLNQLHGNTVTPTQQAATAAYLQTHNIGTTDPAGKSLTLQVGKPDVGGTVRPFTYPGSKLVAATFKCEVGQFLTVDMTVDAQDELTATALATFSPPSSLRSFHFEQCDVTLASVTGTTLGVVKGFELPIQFAYATDRFGLGSALKAQPLVNGYPTVQPKVDIEFKDLTMYNHFVAADVVNFIADFQGPVIEGAHNEQITFTIAAAGLAGETPVVSGPGLLMQGVPLEVLDNGTDAPLAIAYKSTDTTL